MGGIDGEPNPLASVVIGWPIKFAIDGCCLEDGDCESGCCCLPGDVLVQVDGILAADGWGFINPG